MSVRDTIRKVLPYGIVRAIRRRNKGIVGNYRTWEEALQKTGPYRPEMGALIEAVRQFRDGKPSYLNRYDPSRRGVSYPLLAGLLTAAIRCEGHLSVLDFGGSLGQSRFGLEWTLRQLPSPTMWCVVDQPECVDAAKAAFESRWLRFYESVTAAASEQEFNTVVSSSTLQYLDDPYEVLDTLARLKLPNILLDRTAISDGDKELIMHQHTPTAMGGDVHPLRTLSRTKIDAIVAGQGYELHDDYSYGDFPMEGDAATYRYMMYIQEQRNPPRPRRPELQ